MKNSELINEYIEEAISKVFNGSESMVKHFKSNVSDVFKTKEGFYIKFDKPSIETRFCFSYDENIKGSQEEASKMCNVKEDYFKRHNLKELERKLKVLTENEKLYLVKNYDKSEKIMFFVIEEYKRNNPTLTYYELSEEDRKAIIKIQENEISKFNKRLDTYLKKYGTDKLTTWTFSTWD